MGKLNFYEFIKNIIVHKDNSSELSEIEKKLNYTFKDKRLLAFALIHSSKHDDKIGYSHFERMEFLGDSILGFIVTENLFNSYPSKREGELTKIKSKLVSRKFLAYKANELNLDKYLKFTRISNNKGKQTIVGNTIEAIIAAIYLDGGIKPVKTFIEEKIINDFKTLLDNNYLKNYKSLLQEYIQKEYHIVPIYKIVDQEGPDHNKIFTVAMYLNDKLYSSGKGKNKKSAEQEAAKSACEKLGII